MQRLLVACLIVTTFACGTSRTPGRVAGAAAVAVGGTMILGALTTDTSRDNLGDAVRAGIQAEMGGALGAVTVGFGLAVLVVNELRTPTPDEVEPPPPPIVHEPRIIPNGDTVPPPPTDDARLHQLTLQASFAARAGQCTAVRVIAGRVGDLDAPYRDAGFLADPVIRGCL